MRNLIPGTQIDCYSDTAIFRVDTTLLDKTSPTVNLLMSKGERVQGVQGVSMMDSPMNINLQLSEFELTELASLLLGLRNHFKVIRPRGFIEMKRQCEPDSAIAKLYVTSKVKDETRGLAMPIPANRIFYITSLVLKQLKTLSGDLPIEMVVECLKAMNFSSAPNPPIN